MAEVAAISQSRHAAKFILLDEVGRGTATFDGLSIAWAGGRASASRHSRTHLVRHALSHELTELADLLTGVKNIYVSVEEIAQRNRFSTPR